MKLTPRQQQKLSRMVQNHINGQSFESGKEMARFCWHSGAFTSSEQGQAVCKQLVWKGLADEVGCTPTGARTYCPTPAGIALIAGGV